MPFAVVEWDKLLDVVVASLVAGIGVTAAFAVAIFGATRVMDMSRDGRRLETGVYAALALVAFGGVVAAVVFGVIVMTAK